MVILLLGLALSSWSSALIGVAGIAGGAVILVNGRK